MVAKKDDGLEKCMQALKNGDINAIEDIYTITKNFVFAAILSILGDYGLSEDIMFDTYLKVRSSIHTYKDNTHPKAWIIKIARNLALMELRKRKHETHMVPEENERIFGDYTLDSSDDRIVLKTALKELDDSERQIVLLYNSGLKHREISQTLNIPLGTVLWKYNKALSKLRRKLSEGGAGGE